MERILTPSTVTDETTAFLLCNHLGSTTRDDTLADGWQLAGEFKRRVIIADRPGSGYDARPNPYLAADLAANPVPATNVLANRISELIDGEGIQTIAAVGKSAAATQILGLTRTERLPITQVMAAEPIGWLNVPFTEGFPYWWRGRSAQPMSEPNPNLITEDIPSPPLDLAAQRTRAQIIAMKKRQFTDIFNSGRMWATDVAYRDVTHIAQNMPHVETHVVLAENSFVMPPNLIDRRAMVSILSATAVSGGPRTAPFEASILPDTTHASFDRWEVFSACVRQLVHE